MATESPTARIGAATNQPTLWPPRGICCPRGANKSADWNQLQSRAVSPIDFVADFFPRSILEFIGQSFAAKGDERWKFFWFAFLLFQNQAKPMFGQGTKGGFFLARQTLRALEKVIGDFDGCFHNMATHIRIGGRPYQAVFPGVWRRMDEQSQGRVLRIEKCSPLILLVKNAVLQIQVANYHRATNAGNPVVGQQNDIFRTAS